VPTRIDDAALSLTWCAARPSVHAVSPVYERPSRQVPVTQGTLAYQSIRQWLIDHEFTGGQVLSEADLGRRLGVSRTPVREALHRLEVEGWLVSAPGRGHAVVELDGKDVADVYSVRAVLEGLAAREAATRITRADLGKLKDLFAAMEDARAANDNAQLATLNSQFHQAIAAASTNQYLESMLLDIFDVFERFRPIALKQPGRRDHAAEEHKKLIAAFAQGDAERAASLAAEHVLHALQTRLQAMTGPSGKPE
jgi:DNA-binding GntR family transcriptional regulator